jgi:hypothetical protein
MVPALNQLSARRLGLIALACGFITTWILHPGRPAAPPLFDGIPLPQAPYRYESPPPEQSASNQPPLSGSATIPVVGGQSPGAGVQTDDQQVTIFFGTGAFALPASAQTITVRIDPVKEPPPPPGGFRLQGNMYRISARADPGGRSIDIAPGRNYHLTLRLPPGAFHQIQFYGPKGWVGLATTRPPTNDPYAGAVLTAMGEVAATAQNATPNEGLARENPLAIAARYLEGFGLLALVIAFGLIAGFQLLRRRRRPAASPPRGTQRRGR